MNKLLGLAVRFYQLCVAPLLGTHCRYQPSCSSYCKQALQDHGTARGLWFSVHRLLRCNPFFTPGYDPVPPIEKKSS